MSLIIYAPNIHTGGGLVLLRGIVDEWPADVVFNAWLDSRAKDKIRLPSVSNVIWVNPSILSRIAAEIRLARSCGVLDNVLFLHGLPPLWPLKAKVSLFMQNRIILSGEGLSDFPLKTRFRLKIERAVAKGFRFRVNAYWVQTPSMAVLLKKWCDPYDAPICIIPFIPFLPASASGRQKKWDFVYVADGGAHKNHRILIEGWKILAKQGFFPSLALTLSNRDRAIKNWIDKQSCSHNLQVTDLGSLTHVQVFDLYAQSRAVIFPSISESFGLPLLEASSMGIPIIASELDFVRDVCNPVESFDPKSPCSIARAVRRFLSMPESPVRPESVRAFLDSVRS